MQQLNRKVDFCPLLIKKWQQVIDIPEVLLQLAYQICKLVEMSRSVKKKEKQEVLQNKSWFCILMKSQNCTIEWHNLAKWLFLLTKSDLEKNLYVSGGPNDITKPS